jgi:hypothetical protein
MHPIIPPPARFAKAGDEPGRATSAEPRDRADDDVLLACAGCEIAITTRGAAVEIQGTHEHMGVNPHGLSFRIGCYDRAGNLVTSGEITAFWTWFPGYTWQIESCLRCGLHLGWLFRSADRRFHGLIADRLVEIDGAS